MKKMLLVMVMALVLAGCGGEETAVFETVGQVSYEPSELPAAGVISVDIPEQATAEAMAGEDGAQVYAWEEYEVRVETLEAGDLDRTIQTLTGFSKEDLTVMEQKKGDLKLYQTVWSAAGEEGIRLGRAMIADDGNYHYCVSLLSPEESDSQQVYDRLVSSFAVSGTDIAK